jgi:hypothetical protein
VFEKKIVTTVASHISAENIDVAQQLNLIAKMLLPRTNLVRVF